MPLRRKQGREVTPYATAKKAKRFEEFDRMTKTQSDSDEPRPPKRPRAPDLATIDPSIVNAASAAAQGASAEMLLRHMGVQPHLGRGLRHIPSNLGDPTLVPFWERAHDGNEMLSLLVHDAKGSASAGEAGSVMPGGHGGTDSALSAAAQARLAARLAQLQADVETQRAQMAALEAQLREREIRLASAMAMSSHARLVHDAKGSFTTPTPATVSNAPISFSAGGPPQAAGMHFPHLAQMGRAADAELALIGRSNAPMSLPVSSSMGSTFPSGVPSSSKGLESSFSFPRLPVTSEARFSPSTHDTDAAASLAQLASTGQLQDRPHRLQQE
jgi:hypothetical protein